MPTIEPESFIESGQASLADAYLRDLSAQADKAAALGDRRKATSVRRAYHELCRICDGLVLRSLERD